MYSYYPYMPNAIKFANYPYQVNPYDHPIDSYRSFPNPAYYDQRQQSVSGEATWTEGGAVTQCGIPWSSNLYMTAAVGVNSPYQCGQTLKVKNLSMPGQREVMVTVVDKVPGYPSNKINLHRRAFEALGASPSVGIIRVEITPSPELEQEKWRDYLSKVVQVAYPNYSVLSSEVVEKTNVSSTRMREIYDYALQSTQENITVRGTVVYDTETDRMITMELKEV